MVMAVLPALVIVDVLHSVHHLKENDAEDMQQVVGRLTTLFAGRALLLVHHTAKPNLAPGASQQRASTAGRGSSYLGGEMDANWLLKVREHREDESIEDTPRRGRLEIEARFATPFDDIPLIQAKNGLWERTALRPAGRPKVRMEYAEAVELDPLLPTLSLREASTRTGIDRETIRRARILLDTNDSDSKIPPPKGGSD